MTIINSVLNVDDEVFCITGNCIRRGIIKHIKTTTVAVGGDIVVDFKYFVLLSDSLPDSSTNIPQGNIFSTYTDASVSLENRLLVTAPTTTVTRTPTPTIPPTPTVTPTPSAIPTPWTPTQTWGDMQLTGGRWPYHVEWVPHLNTWMVPVHNAGGGNTSGIRLSADGVNWTSPTDTTDIAASPARWGYQIATDGDIVVACSSDFSGLSFIYSEDGGDTWLKAVTEPVGGDYDYYLAVAWCPGFGDGLFVASGADGDTGYRKIATSPDGKNWTLVYTGEIAEWWGEGIAYSPELNRCVVFSSGGVGRVMLYSDDGIAWNEASYPVVPDYDLGKALWSSRVGLFIVTGYQSTRGVLTSPDGITWSLHSDVFEAGHEGCWAITESPELGVFLTTGYNMTADKRFVYISYNGIDWFQYQDILPAPFVGWTSVYYYACGWSPDQGKFMLVGHRHESGGFSVLSPALPEG